MTSKLANAVVRVPRGLQKVLSVQIGCGVDFHGQSPTMAAIKAVSNAMDTASLPAILECVPGGIDGVKVKAKIATPNPRGVNVEEVKKSMRSYYPDPEVKVVHGGMRWHSGIIAPALGDPPPDKQIEAETSDDEDAPVTSNDEFIAVVAAVRVGY